MRALNEVLGGELQPEELLLEAVEAPWKEESEAEGGQRVEAKIVKADLAKLMRRVKEQRRHQESRMTLQELRSRKRMREACEEVGDKAVKKCRPGGSLPQGLVRQVAE